MLQTSIVSASQAPIVNEIVSKIVGKVNHDLRHLKDHGLLSGLAGHLLFLYLAHQHTDLDVDEPLFAEKLEQLQERLAEQSFELSSGLAGQAWFLEYVNQAQQEEYDPELLEEVDRVFLEALNFDPWPGEFEFVIGLAGYAPYTARRSRKTDQSRLYGRLIEHFTNLAERISTTQLTWAQPIQSVFRFDKENPTKSEYNLGLAHGMPSILAALLPAVHIEQLKDQASLLLSQGCDWLLSQQNPNPDDECCFGSTAGAEHSSRLGWCYGDLTIALTLARAGYALDRNDYLERALAIALKAAKRDAQSGAIYDAGLCHGSVGLVVIFQLLNALMPHPELLNAARTWLEFFLRDYRERGLEALYCFDGVTKQHEENQGFLMGSAGIGLGLIAAQSGDVDWAECLLMV